MDKIKHLFFVLIITVITLSLVENIFAAYIPPSKQIPQKAFIDNLSDYNDFVFVGACKSDKNAPYSLTVFTNEIGSIFYNSDGQIKSQFYDYNGQIMSCSPIMPFNETANPPFESFPSRLSLIKKSSLESIGGISKLKFTDIIKDSWGHYNVDDFKISNPELINNFKSVIANNMIPIYIDTNDLSKSKIIFYSLSGDVNYSNDVMWLFTSRIISVYDDNQEYKYKIEHCLDKNNIWIEYANQLDENYNPINSIIITKPNEKKSIFLTIGCFFKRLFGKGC